MIETNKMGGNMLRQAPVFWVDALGIHGPFQKLVSPARLLLFFSLRRWENVSLALPDNLNKCLNANTFVMLHSSTEKQAHFNFLISSTLSTLWFWQVNN